MKIKDLTTVLTKLEELGFGDTELYTEWDEKSDRTHFKLYLNGINEDDFKQIFPHNPFVNNIEVHSFGISKEMSFIEKNCVISNCFELHSRMMDWKNEM